MQSYVPEIAELYFYLNMIAYKGELEKTATFKDKVRQQPDNVNAGLLTYPVLQTADIFIHRAIMYRLEKTRSNILRWRAILQNVSITAMVKYFPNRRPLILEVNL